MLQLSPQSRSTPFALATDHARFSPIDETAELKLLAVGTSIPEAESFFALVRQAGYRVRPHRLPNASRITDDSTTDWDFVVFTEIHSMAVVLRSLSVMRITHPDAAIVVLSEQLSSRDIVSLTEAGARWVHHRSNPNDTRAVIQNELEGLKARWRARHFEQLYWNAQHCFTSLVADSTNAMAYLSDGTHLLVNQRYAETFGYREVKEIETVSVLDLVHPGSTEEFRAVLRSLLLSTEPHTTKLPAIRASGRTFPAQFTFTPAVYDGNRCHQLVVSDLSLDDQSGSDVPSANSHRAVERRLSPEDFLAHLSQNLESSRENLHLALVELEDCHVVRKRIGIRAVAEMIEQLARLIRSKLAPTDTLTAIADSTFAIVTSDSYPKHTYERLETMRRAIERHIYEYDNRSTATSCSIGVARLDGDWSAERALSAADEACRNAVHQGGSRLCFHHPSESISATREELEAHVSGLLTSDRLSLVFQPIVSLTGSGQDSYEVLLRASSIEGRPIAPNDLFEAASNVGLGTALDCWVLEEAARTACERRTAGQEVRFFVKLSENAMHDESVLVRLTRILQTYDVLPSQLVFQLDEGVVTGHVKMARTVINLLGQLNCSTALEHFGTKQNLFGTLEHLDVDYLKLDRSCIEGLLQDTKSQQRLRKIQRTASALKKATIATAVQDANSLAILWNCGIHLAQGHYIQEPAPDLTYEFSALAAS